MVSVPVRALGSFLRGSESSISRIGSRCFSAREGSGVFSTGCRARTLPRPGQSCFSALQALGSFLLVSRPGVLEPGDCLVSVPVRALGSFLPTTRSSSPTTSRRTNSFSARESSGVFSTRATPRRRTLSRRRSMRFSAREGSGVFSTGLCQLEYRPALRGWFQCP
jgi:hypothetical protein